MDLDAGGTHGSRVGEPMILGAPVGLGYGKWIEHAMETSSSGFWV